MPYPILTQTILQEARAKLNRLNNGRKIHNDEEACHFIKERGFVLLMPVAGISLPSLAGADMAAPWDGFACTDRVWNWKETLPERKLCAYTKLIRGRGTFISWELYPSFLKAYGPDGDPDYEYDNGRLKRAEVDLFHLVKEYGPINSRELWLKAKPVFDGKRQHFSSALERLQSRFYLTVAGGSLEGWTLHTWDLVERQIPKEVTGALPSLAEARRNILRQTILNSFAVTERKLRSLLSWSPVDLRQVLGLLKEEKVIVEVAAQEEIFPYLMDHTNLILA